MESSPLRRLPSLDAVRGFEAAARHLSFTRAGAELALTQSAISRQVQSLEEALQIKLFTRLHRALKLTDHGEVFLRAAKNALDELDRAARALTGAHAHAPLTLSVTVSFASLWLIPRLPRWRALHPEIDVRIQADDRNVDLRASGIDLAIRFCHPALAPVGTVPLSEEHVFPVAAPALLNDPARPLRKAQDLQHHVLLNLDIPAHLNLPELTWSQWLTALGVPHLEPAGRLMFSQYDHLIRAAIEGQGIALGRTLLLENELQQGHLVPLFTRDVQSIDSARRYFVLLNPEQATNPARRTQLDAFEAWLRSEIVGAVGAVGAA